MGMNRDLMRQMQKMQERLAKAQEELLNTSVQGSAGGGAVTADVTGGLKVIGEDSAGGGGPQRRGDAGGPGHGGR
jgi:hypothetical protein